MLKGIYFLPLKTVHTARTMMFEEISRVMDYSGSSMNFMDGLTNNVSGKQTQNNLKRTNAALKKLYSLEKENLPFRCFQQFWQIAPEGEKNLLALIYALGMDFMLYEVADAVSALAVSDNITSTKFANILGDLHANDFSPITIASASRNLISSFRQAGILTGHGKNIKTPIRVSAHHFAFACLMAYFNDDRGEFILQSKWIRILGIDNNRIKELASEASIKGLMEFKYAGSVVTISFNNLFTSLGLYGIES